MPHRRHGAAEGGARGDRPELGYGNSKSTAAASRALGALGVRLEDRDDSFYRFDLAVMCAPADAGCRYVVDPILIVEVLSTQLHDRGRKLDDYRQLPSVKEILLVGSEQRRVQHSRSDGARWIVEDLADADLRLAAVPARSRSPRSTTAAASDRARRRGGVSVRARRAGRAAPPSGRAQIPTLTRQGC